MHQAPKTPEACDRRVGRSCTSPQARCDITLECGRAGGGRSRKFIAQRRRRTEDRIAGRCIGLALLFDCRRPTFGQRFPHLTGSGKAGCITVATRDRGFQAPQHTTSEQ
jgi:hypothetical protein